MIDSRDIKTSNIRNQHGFTLLEVLIALLILSIGLLGLAALQTTGMRMTDIGLLEKRGGKSGDWVAPVEPTRRGQRKSSNE